MSYFSVGQVIKNARKRNGMTQEELADGICAVSSLSRIENGKQMPHALTFEALMHRMGESCELYHNFLKDIDFEHWKLLDDIEQGLWLHEWKVLKEQFEFFQKSTRSGHRLEQQWELMIKQSLLFREGKDFFRIGEQLIQIIGMTICGFCGEWIERRGYTRCELYGIFLWALCLKRQEKKEQSLRIFRHLLEYLNQNVYDDWMCRLQERAYYHATQLFFEIGDYRNSARICEAGIKNCLNRKKYHIEMRLFALLPHILAELDEQENVKMDSFFTRFLDEICSLRLSLSKYL